MRAFSLLCLLAVAALGPDALGKAPPPPQPIVTPAAIRAAINDLIATYGSRYDAGPSYLSRLDQLEKRPVSTEGDRAAVQLELTALQREALLANPLLADHPLLFVARNQYAPDHHNTATMFQTGEINTGSFHGPGALKLLDLKTGAVTTLVDLPEGIVRDPEVSWDGQRILFSMRRNRQDDYHLYELSLPQSKIANQQSQIHQLTFGAGITDIDPFYLADDRIAFSSTREPKYCMCNRHIMGNLYVMDADGANIHQIGKSTLHEAHGSLMPDGRILYDRWEYVDRNFGDAQGLWTCNPDGTAHLVYYGNNTPSPGGVIDARAIPGTSLVMAVLGSCHDRPWGALGIIDAGRGVDGKAPVVRTWPPSAIDLVKDPGTANNAWDTFVPVRPKYEDPYPLSDKYFLCSRMTGNGEQMAIYLLDTFGNEVLVHQENLGCYDPMPLAPRTRPPTIPQRRDYDNGDGYFYVYDVYQGTHMKGVKRGAIKSLRVIESPEKRFWTHPSWDGQGVHCPGMNWHSFENKRILGTVPVEEDGSAYFAVPSDKFVYFQCLDENGMMVQSMRSGTMVQSGERSGCVGCHDGRLSVPPARENVPMALRRPASKLTGWYGPPREFSFMAEVQPVLDRACVKCHDFGTDGGKKLLLCRDKNAAFNFAYTEIWSKHIIKVVGAGPAETQQPYSWGSHASKLIQQAISQRDKGNLSKEDLDRLITWVDINAPYYPSYATNFPDNEYGRSPLTKAQTARLKALGINDMAISFDRPDLSPALGRFKEKSDPMYREALAIIRAGGEALAKSPRPDMSGFVPCTIDNARDRKYVQRLDIEKHNREALRDGRKLYDN